MDAKEQNLVADLYRRIRKRAFHERDVLALLILLRPHADRGSAVRELSDFVAHREKDRGSLQKYVHHVVAYGEALVKNTSAGLKIDVVHSAHAFRDSLNLALARFRLPALEVDVTDDVLACVMSLLQDVRLLHNRVEIGRLGLCRFKKELWLCGSVIMPPPKDIRVVFPALIVANKYCSSANDKECNTLSGLAEARCRKGRLRFYVAGKDAAQQADEGSGRLRRPQYYAKRSVRVLRLSVSRALQLARIAGDTDAVTMVPILTIVVCGVIGLIVHGIGGLVVGVVVGWLLCMLIGTVSTVLSGGLLPRKVRRQTATLFYMNHQPTVDSYMKTLTEKEKLRLLEALLERMFRRATIKAPMTAKSMGMSLAEVEEAADAEAATEDDPQIREIIMLLKDHVRDTMY